MTPAERRRKVARILNDVWDFLEDRHGDVPHGVYPLHIRIFFREPERHVRDVSLGTVKKDLRWLLEKGYVARMPAKRTEYKPTPAGRVWARGR